MLLNNYLTSFLCKLYPVDSCWLNLTETLPLTCMLTTHNTPYFSQSVTTTEPHGGLVIPLSPPPGRPWPSFLKNAVRALGYLVLSTQAALNVYFPHLCMLLNDATFRWSCYRSFLCTTKQEMVHSFAGIAFCRLWTVRRPCNACSLPYETLIVKEEVSFLTVLVLRLVVPLCCKH